MTVPPSASIDSMSRMTGAGGAPALIWRAVSPRGSGAFVLRRRRGFFSADSVPIVRRSGRRVGGVQRGGRLQVIARVGDSYRVRGQGSEVRGKGTGAGVGRGGSGGSGARISGKAHVLFANLPDRKSVV